MKKRTSKMKTAKQQTGRCPETLPSPPYRGEKGGLLASVLLLLPLLLHPLVLCKISIITKKPVVAKRHISIYVRVCVCVVEGGVFLHASVRGAVIFSEH